MGETALDHAPAVLEAYAQAQQREIGALANDAQQRMLEVLSQRRQVSFGEQIEGHSAAERLRWHDTTSERRIAQMRADAGFYWSDDALLRRALGTTRAEVRDTAERHHWDAALTETTLRQQASRTLVSASPDRDVWVENPDGTFTNHGPAEAFTGSGKATGERGKNRESNKTRGPGQTDRE